MTVKKGEVERSIYIYMYKYMYIVYTYICVCVYVCVFVCFSFRSSFPFCSLFNSFPQPSFPFSFLYSLLLHSSLLHSFHLPPPAALPSITLKSIPPFLPQDEIQNNRLLNDHFPHSLTTSVTAEVPSRRPLLPSHPQYVRRS